jgi:hypothetical protein
MYKFYRFYLNCKGVVKRLRKKHILDHMTPKHFQLINDASYFTEWYHYTERNNSNYTTGNPLK